MSPTMLKTRQGNTWRDRLLAGLLCLLVITLTACGKTGSLYLPDEKPANEQVK